MTKTQHIPSQEAVESHLEDDADNVPPVYEPEYGHPVSTHDVTPGDVLATRNLIRLVVDVAEDAVITYYVGEQRYGLLGEGDISVDIQADRMNHYEAVVSADSPTYE